MSCPWGLMAMTAWLLLLEGYDQEFRLVERVSCTLQALQRRLLRHFRGRCAPCRFRACARTGRGAVEALQGADCRASRAPGHSLCASLCRRSSLRGCKRSRRGWARQADVITSCTTQLMAAMGWDWARRRGCAWRACRRRGAGGAGSDALRAQRAARRAGTAPAGPGRPRARPGRGQGAAGRVPGARFGACMPVQRRDSALVAHAGRWCVGS